MAETYYAPTLGFAVVDQNNNYVSGTGFSNCTPHYDPGSYSMSCQFAGAQGATYTAEGFHGVELLQQYECNNPPDCSYNWVDFENMFELSPFDFVDLGEADYYGPGPDTPVDSPDIGLGRHLIALL
jgi:hypothetical protein